MSVFVNSPENTVLQAFAGQASKDVTSAIYSASRETGVDFAYLMQQASLESSFRPDAKAATSSATGLYQFIDSTWLNMVERHGEKYGIDPNASKQKILELRKDPELASNMAAELAKDNQKFLQTHWGGDVGATELYFAHFLGAGGAASFLNARDENPLQIAADLFPAAANANRNVFYDKETGRARTLAEVYDSFDNKFQLKDGQGAPPKIDDFYRENLEKEMIAYGTGGPLHRPSYNSSYQSMVINPVQVMMMAQLEMPFGAENSKFSLF